MKAYIFISLLFSVAVFGQKQAPTKQNKSSVVSCPAFAQKHYDRVTGRTVFAGKNKLILTNNGRTGIILSLYMTAENSIVISMVVADGQGGCIDEDSNVYFLFTDGTRLTLENGAKFNCDGEVNIYLFPAYNQDSLYQLVTKKIETIRVMKYKGSVQQDFTPAQANTFVNQLNCLFQISGMKTPEPKDLDRPIVLSPGGSNPTTPKRQASSAMMETTKPKTEETKAEEDKKALEEEKPVEKPPENRVVSLGVINGKASHFVTPSYPPAAKAVRASGAVNVQVKLDKEGNVISAVAVSGHPLLRYAAEEAARKCKFSPTILSGEKVLTTGILVFNFVAM